MARWPFLFKTLRRYALCSDISCPHCKSCHTRCIGTKWFVLQLRSCQDCHLMFRYPKDDNRVNYEYYQKDYDEPGLTSEIPDEQTLNGMLKSEFRNTNKDLSEKIRLLKRYKSAGQLLDYGCSWGYGLWQFQKAGFKAGGVEISAPRANFGSKKLGLTIVPGTGTLPDESFDVIFTNHVLEHLPNLFKNFSELCRLLKKDGVLMISVPDATGCERHEIFEFKKSYAFGEKHTFAFSRDFFYRNLPKHGLKICAYYDKDNVGFQKMDLFELIVICSKLECQVFKS